MNLQRKVVVLAAVALASCAASGVGTREPQAIEARSLLGEELRRPVLPAEERALRETALDLARERLAAAPDDPQSWIWVGRRLANLGRVREALAHYDTALERFPRDPRLLRHRGHRRLTARDLDGALHDLSSAAEILEAWPDEVEPDSLPNSRNEPRSTLKGNVFYHLGLAHFVRGDPARALSAFGEAQAFATNDDALVSVLYWRTLCGWRIGLEGEAVAILEELPTRPDVVENEDYLTLLRYFRGEIEEDRLLDCPQGLPLATRAFGAAQLRALRGDHAGANELYVRILDETPWMAFGHLAAEGELARL